MWMVSASAMTAFALLAVGPLIGLIRRMATSYNARTAAPQNRILRSLWEIQHSRLLNAGMARRLVTLSTIRFGVVVLMAGQTSEAIHANIPALAYGSGDAVCRHGHRDRGNSGWNRGERVYLHNSPQFFGTPLATAAGWSLANRVLITASCFAVASFAVLVWGIERISASRKDANK